MLPFQRTIDRQVLGLMGFTLPGVDFDGPAGDQGLFGPGSAVWAVHGDLSTVLYGGIGSMLLQMLHPLALSGIHDHSVYREDLIGRLQRTNQFIFAVSFAGRDDADRMVRRVNAIHAHVRGTAPDGRAYAATDPELVTWVHIAQVRTFLASYLRYVDPSLSVERQDQYYRETASLARALGGEEVPSTRAEVERYLDAMRPHLLVDARTRELSQVLMNASLPGVPRILSRLSMATGVDLIPDWAAADLGLSLSPLARRTMRFSARAMASLIRTGVRDGAAMRSARRVSQPVTSVAA